jgi:type II secretory pathway pseudopilin PulG
MSETAKHTPLEIAQLAYDRAVTLRDDAAAALKEKDQAVIAARGTLDVAKRSAAAAIPVDRSDVQLSGGGRVTEDHQEIQPQSGQQKGYVVLTPTERAKGFTRPYRDAYRHLKCGKITTMSRDIAETYARDPHFYGGTFCSTCRAHFPVGENGEFTWYEMDGREGPKVGT